MKAHVNNGGSYSAHVPGSRPVWAELNSALVIREGGDPYTGPTTVTPDETEQTLATSSKYVTSDITVEAIDDEYVGSAVPRNDSDDLTASGDTVTAPVGYYAANASKAVDAAAWKAGSILQPTMTTTVDAAGLVTAKASGTMSVWPIQTSGWALSTRAYPIIFNETDTLQLPTQAPDTITPSSSSQTAVAAGRFTTGAVTVAAVPTETASVTPSTSAQTITPTAGHFFDEVDVAAFPTGSKGGSGTRTITVSTESTKRNYTIAWPDATSGYYPDTTFKPSETLSLTRQSATVTPSNTTQTISPSGSFYYLDSVTVDPMPSGTEGTPTATKGTVSNHSISVTPSVTNTAGYISGGTKTGTAVTVSASELVSGSKTISTNGTGIDVADYATVDVDVPSGGAAGITVIETTDTSGGICKNIVGVDISADTVDAAHLLNGYTAHDAGGNAISGEYVAPTYTSQAKTNISPTTSSQTIQPDEGYDGLSSVQINAMPSGSATAASSITATGATVSTGTNTLTLSKTVSNTPQVTAGYVASGTAGNSSVSLTASVTTQAAQTLYPSTSDQTISSGRYLTGTQTVKAVAVSNTLSADNVKSGVTITIGDSADADRIMSVTGTYSGGGSSKAFQIDNTNHRIATTAYTDTGAYLKVAKAGKYDIYWSAFRSSTSSGTNGTQWYKNGVAQGSAYTSWSNSYCQNPHISGVTLALNDEIKVYAKSSSNSRYVCVENLMIIEVD